MKTYVVIPQYIVTEELRDLALNAIKSFREATPDAVIISVDDGGVPKLFKPVGEASDVVITNKKNQGFAPTCNNGFKWIFKNIKEDCFIVCANNDILVYKGWDEAMKQPFSEWDNVAITGLISTMADNMDGVPLVDFKRYKITDGGLLDGWMQAGGLLMSKKSILLKLADYVPKR